MAHPWIAQRTKTFDDSGIRKVFDLAASMKDPINLSIGQPDFEVPQPIQDAAIDAIRSRRSGYAPTQGIAPLREQLQKQVDRQYGHSDRMVAITSGTSGALVAALLAMVNPGDEVIVFDPYFVMYPALVELVGGKCVFVDTYPDFRLDPARVGAALSPRTKLILFNSPANPTGHLASEEEVRALAQLAFDRNIALLSDEIYSQFCYDQPLVSPAQFNDQTIVIDGFSKSHGVTGWRVGFVHGPAEVVQTMLKVQQYSFVCAPQPFQWGCVAASEVDMTPHVREFARRRDMLIDGLQDLYEIQKPGGAFYLFPKTPWGTGTELVHEAIVNSLLIIPGGVFSRQDTHFRLSYAADERTIERGIEVLRKLARR